MGGVKALAFIVVLAVAVSVYAGEASLSIELKVDGNAVADVPVVMLLNGSPLAVGTNSEGVAEFLGMRRGVFLAYAVLFVSGGASLDVSVARYGQPTLALAALTQIGSPPQVRFAFIQPASFNLSSSVAVVSVLGYIR